MGKEMYRDVRFFHGALQLRRADTITDKIVSLLAIDKSFC